MENMAQWNGCERLWKGSGRGCEARRSLLRSQYSGFMCTWSLCILFDSVMSQTSRTLSRRREFCHSAAPPSTFSRCLNRDNKKGCEQNDSPLADGCENPHRRKPRAQQLGHLKGTQPEVVRAIMLDDSPCVHSPRWFGPSCWTTVHAC